MNAAVLSSARLAALSPRNVVDRTTSQQCQNLDAEKHCLNYLHETPGWSCSFPLKITDVNTMLIDKSEIKIFLG